MWWWLAVLACSSEVGLVPIAPTATAPAAPTVVVVDEPVRPPDQPPTIPDEPTDWVVAPTTGNPTATGTRFSPGAGLREDTFAVGLAEPTLTDVLFVVDNSASMSQIIEQAREGLTAIARAGVFPPGTRIAVTSTTPAAPFAPDRPHEAVHRAGVVLLDPGFNGLVDRDRLARFAANAPADVAGAIRAPGCDAWFAPDARAADGTPCLLAHTQIAETRHQVEAGLVTLGQLLEREPGLFRPGAAVNIVLMSDTHDPGIPTDHPAFADLVALRPDATTLADRASRGGPLASFRLHAIAPRSHCVTQEPWVGAVYHDAAAETGGQSLDICTAKPADYLAFARTLATAGSHAQAPVVALTQPASQVRSVWVQGKPTGYAIGENGRSLLLDGELPAERQQVRVRYLPAPAATPASARPGRRR